MRRMDHELLSLKFDNTGLSYKLLAEKSEVSRGTLHNVMYGRTTPSHYVAYGLADALLLSPEDITQIFFPKIQF